MTVTMAQMATFDDVLEVTGRIGWFQIRSFIFLLITHLIGSWVVFALVFIGGTNDHWCTVGQLEQEDCMELNMTSSDCDQLKRDLTTSGLSEGDAKCMKYNISGNDVVSALAQLEDVTKPDVIPCDDGWTYDRSMYGITVTEEWNLVCDYSTIPNILMSTFFGGILLGCLVFGYLADRIGRYRVFCICIIGAALCSLLSALSPHVLVFGSLRFMLGFFMYGSALVTFVIATELVLPDKRVYLGTGVWYCFALGQVLLPGLAILIPNWRHLIIVTTMPFLLLVPAFWFLTESPRWLVADENFEEAEKVIQEIAKVNKKEIPHNLLTKLREEYVKAQADEQTTFRNLIRNPVLMVYFICLLYIWFAQSFVYYGLSLGTSSLGMNIHAAFSISGAVELPAYAFSMFTMNKFGRRLSTGGLTFVAGLACLGTILIPVGPFRVTVAMVGKFAITASFANIYLHTSEIFPTPLRTSVTGICSVAARVGGMVAPLILVLGQYWVSLPLVCFGVSAILAAFLMFMLPETKGRSMPDTIGDSVKLRRVPVRNEDNSVGGAVTTTNTITS
ncbi:organic cation transporter protein-like isoform X2 [Apostichopus japonicus]|uniref:organic cation transporter protein-like isoform X2 n=1 Tax=Stichopus japonicus TaxID=307972 RepID=UPI003AB59612